MAGFTGKKLLSNHLRHAESHNKIKEERDMWQQREIEKKRERFCDDWSLRANYKVPPLVRGHLISDDLDNSSSSPSPPSSSSQSRHFSPAHLSSPAHSANHWTRQLMKAEEADPFRWGHSGYKEQHPDEFVSSDEAEKQAKARRKEKKKKKKQSGKKSKKKDPKSKGKEKKHVSKHKWKRTSPPGPQMSTRDSSSESESSGYQPHTTSRSRKRKRLD